AFSSRSTRWKRTRAEARDYNFQARHRQLTAVSKHVFQSELQNPWFARRRTDEPKVLAVQGGRRVSFPNAVRHVERFHAGFKPLTLSHCKRTGQSQIEIPEARSKNIVPAHVAQRPCGRNGKSRSVKVRQEAVRTGRRVAVRHECILLNLIGSLRSDTGQGHIRS